MLDQVAQPLLDVLRTSADFEAAYTPLLVMAARLYPQDPRRAEQLLAALEAAAPRRPEAGRLRSRLEKGG
jgi:spermidine synthase